MDIVQASFASSLTVHALYNSCACVAQAFNLNKGRCKPKSIRIERKQPRQTVQNTTATRIMMENKRWIYATRPEGELKVEHFKLETCSAPAEGDLNDGEVIVKALYFSVDPYMRIQMSAKDTWEAPPETGKTQEGGVVGEIVGSRCSNFKTGDIVFGYLGWQLYSVAKAPSLRLVDPSLAPVSTALGVLGMPGVTAYCGLLSVGNPQENETVVVSGAAGAVGSIVGQIARITGCRVVGLAGSPEKITFLKEELGFDDAVNYKDHPSQKDLEAALSKACPNGIDVYFDNTGGPITDAVMNLINLRARICICGQISQYQGHLDQPQLGPRFLHRVLYTRCKIEGLLARDYFAAGKQVEAWDQLSKWIKSGELRYRETIIEGFDHLPSALIEQLGGKNFGKMVVKS